MSEPRTRAELMYDVAWNLYDKRFEAGLTQHALAGKAGVKRERIAMIEVEKSLGSIEVLEALACSLGISIGELTERRSK